MSREAHDDASETAFVKAINGIIAKQAIKEVDELEPIEAYWIEMFLAVLCGAALNDAR